jgi:acyl carrier protein
MARQIHPDRQAILDAVAERFDVAVHPAEADLLRTVEELQNYVAAKLVSRGTAKQWPALQISNTLRTIIAEQLGLWPEDIRPWHAFDYVVMNEDWSD